MTMLERIARSFEAHLGSIDNPVEVDISFTWAEAPMSAKLVEVGEDYLVLRNREGRGEMIVDATHVEYVAFE